MTANAGYHAYATGDVLTAAQVQYNLQNQTVMYFATSAARTTALSGVIVEGMVTYIPANGLEYYNGSAWVVLSTGGDITGVTAGTGISGGGTSGTVTVTNSMATEITAAGDIIVGTGSGTFDNLPIGTTGQLLTADTTVSPYKVKWSTVSTSPTFVGVAATANLSSLAVVGNVQISLPFATEDFDTDSFHSTSVNTSRITIPTGKGGKYLLNVGLDCDLSTNYALLIFVKNGSNTGGSTGPNGAFYTAILNVGSNSSKLFGSCVLALAAGDYIEVGFQNSSTGTMTYNARFSAVYLGA